MTELIPLKGSIMAVKQTKVRKPHRRAAQKTRSPFISYLILGGLVLMGGAGWYHTNYEVETGEHIEAQAPKSLVSPSIHVTPSNKAGTTVAVAPKSVDPHPVNVPVPSASQLANPTTAVVTPKEATPLVPYKADKNLPPKARFAANNAANAIFATAPTPIFMNADSHSKVIATFKIGQEMRSYDRQGSWHRVVVPSTDIIGWANDKSLSEKSPTISGLIDNAITSSVKH